MVEAIDPEVLRLFARLLEYPRPGIEGLVRRAVHKLQNQYPEAAALISGFDQYISHNPLAQLEDVYTYTFDLQGVCQPYIGHHLFGETHKRSRFMARLNAEYRQRGFEAGNELPDHIAVIMAFLAHGELDEFSRPLLDEGLVPTLGNMLEGLEQKKGNPYLLILRSIWLVLGCHEQSQQTMNVTMEEVKNA